MPAILTEAGSFILPVMLFQVGVQGWFQAAGTSSTEALSLSLNIGFLGSPECPHNMAADFFHDHKEGDWDGGG